VDKDANLQAFCSGLFGKSFKESQAALALDEALSSLYILFIHSARLQDYVNRKWLLEFAGAKPPPNPYRDAEAAHRALRAHPIYRWLKRRKHAEQKAVMPNVMKQAPTEAMKEFRFVLELLSHLYVASLQMTAPEGRPDKRRASAKRRIADLLDDLKDGTVALPRAERAVLRSLLGKASRGLRRQQPKPISYPVLQSLARTRRAAALVSTNRATEGAVRSSSALASRSRVGRSRGVRRRATPIRIAADAGSRHTGSGRSWSALQELPEKPRGTQGSQYEADGGGER